jgi:hypothetical protein
MGGNSKVMMKIFVKDGLPFVSATITVYGVGGKEFVYTKTMDKVMIGAMVSDNFQLEVGKMDYGLNIDGIIGFNFMQSTGMTIDTKT